MQVQQEEKVEELMIIFFECIHVHEIMEFFVFNPSLILISFFTVHFSIFENKLSLIKKAKKVLET